MVGNRALKGKELKEYNKNRLERARIQDEYQRMMNIDVELMQGDIDHAALNALGNDIRPLMQEAFVGISKKPEAMPDGRYYWFLYAGTREGVIDSMLGWGRPTAIIWFNEASGVDTSSYNPRRDAIKLRNYTKLLGNRRPLFLEVFFIHIYTKHSIGQTTLWEDTYTTKQEVMVLRLHLVH